MYSYKDVLFALREEYLKNEEVLEGLKKLVSLKKDKSSINFHLEKEDENKWVDLFYEVKSKQNFIRRLIDRYTGIDRSIDTGKMAKTPNGEYIGDTKSFYVEENEEFDNLFSSLLNNQFVINTFNTKIDNNEEFANIDRNLSIYPDRIVTYKRVDTDITSSVYDPKIDRVSFTKNKKGKMSYDEMYSLLELEIPKENMPEELKLLIESSDTFGKNAYIYDNDDKKNRKEFVPVDEGKRLVLLRK